MVFNKNWINFFLKYKPKLSSNLVFFYFFPALATVLILNYFLLNKSNRLKLVFLARFPLSKTYGFSTTILSILIFCKGAWTGGKFPS